MAIITLPTHVSADDIRDNSINRSLSCLSDDQLNSVIFTAEKCLFLYLGMWFYESIQRFYYPMPWSNAMIQVIDRGDPGMKYMTNMPNDMKLAVIRICENIVVRGGGGTKKNGGYTERATKEQIGDHVVERTNAVDQYSYKVFITPDVQAMVSHYSLRDRFLSSF